MTSQRYETQRMAFKTPFENMKTLSINAEIKNINPILPPLVKRDMPVNAAWNNLLNHNFLSTFTPNAISNKAANLFSNKLETQAWRLGKEATIKESEIAHHSSSREVSLEEIDEKRTGISDRYINLRKSFKGMVLGTQMKVVGKKSTFKVQRSLSRGRT